MASKYTLKNTAQTWQAPAPLYSLINSPGDSRHKLNPRFLCLWDFQIS